MRKKLPVVFGLVLIVTASVQCSKTDADINNVAFKALPLSVIFPAENLQTPSKIALGQLLFWDPMLSGGKEVACASCHHPSLGYSDHLDLSIGVNGQGLGTSRHFLSPNTIPFARQNALSIINTAFNGIGADGTSNPATAAMFFDNRSRSLEAQSVEPIKTMEEMKGQSIAAANILDTVIVRLKNIPQYQQLFTAAFGVANAISTQNLGKAIAAYERSIISNQSPYDKYIRGDKTAMTAIQIQGMQVFADNGCDKCHSGPMFSDYSLHILSVPDNAKLPTDAGANGTYAFRTPSLRNLSLTAPCMHSGVFNSLDQVMNFYDQIGDRRSQNGHVNNNQIDGNIQRFNRNDQNAILQFLNALNDGNFDKTIPATVPSGLHPGGNL